MRKGILAIEPKIPLKEDSYVGERFKYMNN
jgi:hypothetical protein